MSKSLSMSSYKISTDPLLRDEQDGITPQIRYHLEKAYDMALNKSTSGEKKLSELIVKYPHVPQFKNYLSVWYSLRGHIEKSREINHRIVAEHPAYLFGKLNLVQEYLNSNQHEKVPGLLGEAMELQHLYPERDTFHIDEVVAFLKTAIRYFLVIDETNLAQNRLDMLLEVAPDDEDAENLAKQISFKIMGQAAARFEEKVKQKIKVKVEANALKSTQTAPPAFTHPEIAALYEYNMRIDIQLLHTILALPRESVIADLEKVLIDSIERFNHFNQLLDTGDVYLDFTLHALYLLGELKAEESLPVILKVLSQHDEYYDIYFGDWIHEGCWEPIYKLANRQLETLKAYMLEPDNYTYARNVVIGVLEQIAMHQPQRNEEVVNWFIKLLEAYGKSSLDDNVVDSELIAFMACSLVDLIGKEAGAHLKPLFDKGWVATSVCGNYNELMKSAGKRSMLDEKSLLTIDDRYQEIVSTWACYNETGSFTTS